MTAHMIWGMIVVIGVFVVGSPSSAHAQLADAITLTNQAIIELTDLPGSGKRAQAEFSKIGGADIRQIVKANGLLQEALSKARSGNAPALAIMKLEEAIDATAHNQHKEPRLYAQGALFHLCAAANGEPKDICEKVPRTGSYVAP